MKTSNKLLVITVLLLLAAAVVNALALKKQYNAMVMHTPGTLENFHAEAFNSVELLGTAPKAMGLRVTVKRADRINVQYTKLDYIHIAQEGTTLKITVDHPKGYTTNVRKQPKNHHRMSGAGYNHGKWDTLGQLGPALGRTCAYKAGLR